MDNKQQAEEQARKKRPPKLKPIQQVNISSNDTDASDNPNSTNSNSGDDNELQTTVKVKIDSALSQALQNKEILIQPNNISITKQLGRGQYGIVEKVVHTESGCELAVKRVPLSHADENERRRLLMDANVLIRTNECKNIIKFYGALIWEGDLWTFMELMDCSLDRFYKLVFPGNSNGMPEKVLGKIAADIVHALSYLYSIKIIHRDVKPSNILINKLGIVKLCDFGISGYLVNSVAKTYDAGCRPYMAPERIDPPKDSHGYDIKSDVWSLGITILETANGQYPYHKARDFFEQLKMICSDGPPQLPKDKYSYEFNDFINQCLQRNFKFRPNYEILQKHLFVTKHSNEDISDYVSGILSSALVL